MTSPPHARLIEALRRETQGEILRWAGQSGLWRNLFRHSVSVLFGVGWLAFAVFGQIALIVGFYHHANKTWLAVGVFCLFTLINVVFVTLGYRLLAPPFWLAWNAKHTIHAVTNRRLVTLRAGRRVRIRTILPADIFEVEREERPDGSGNLVVILDDEKEIFAELHDIADVRRVEGLLMELKYGRI